MDAITKKKSLAGVIVALLVGAVFATVVPTAAATHASGTAPDAAVDTMLLHDDNLNGTVLTAIANTTIPTDGKLRVGATYDLTFSNISQTVDVGYGYSGTANGLYLQNTTGAKVGNTRNLGDDLAHIGMYNVTFPAQLLNETGYWRVMDANDDEVSKFFVWPQPDLTVTLSQNAFVFSEAAVAFSISVGGIAPGETAYIFGTGIPALTTVTGAGVYNFFGPLPEAGTFTINATINNAGPQTAGAFPEREGSATYTVNPAGLNKVDVIVSPKAGFSGITIWNTTYPNTIGVLSNAAGTLTRSVNSYNLTIVGPGAWGTLWINDTDGSLAAANLRHLQGSGTPTACSANGAGNWTCGYNAVEFHFNTLGNFTFSPNATWPAGQFTYSLIVDRLPLATPGSPEYSTAWIFTAATPAEINLDLTGNDTVNVGVRTLENVSVIESGPLPLSVGAAPTGPPGSYTFSLLLTGNAQTIHPRVTSTGAQTGSCPSLTLCNTRIYGDAWTAANPQNITVTGDVIILDRTLWTYNEATGVVTMTGIVPTKAGGSVVISVNWLNTTTTLTLPVINGAVLSATPTELIVDTTTSVVFHLSDAFGNSVPDGKIFLYKKPSGSAAASLVGATSVNGTGAPDFGAGGNYKLTLTPGTVGKYIAYGIIGRQEGATDHRNFSYVEINVVPAHDVTVTMTPLSTMASVTTAYMLNATIPDGRSLGVSAQLYLLNESQIKDFHANFTLAASGHTYAPAALTSVNAPLNAAGGVTNYFFNATLAPGNYSVYICGNAGGGTLAALCGDARHDDNQSLPTLVVNKFTATFTPALVADNPLVQANASVEVRVTDASGNPWNGTLTMDSTSTGKFAFTNQTGNTVPQVSIVNGVGHFAATGFTSGDVMWLFDPAGSAASPLSSLVNDNFEVVGPNIQITPSRVPVGTTSTLAVTVLSLNGTALAGLDLKFCGVPISTTTGCTENKTTDAAGVAQFGVFPTTNGNMSLVINGSTTKSNVTAYSGLDVLVSPASPVANDTVTLKIVQVGKTAGETGVAVAVTRNGVALSGFPTTTGSTGEVVIPSAQEGTYSVLATKGSFEPGQTTFTVGPKAPETPSAQAKFVLSNLNVPTTGTVGTPLDASADLQNTGSATGTANVLLLVNGQVRDSRAIPVAAGGKETVAFSFAPTQSGSFKVTIKLAETGETLADKTVTVTAPQVTTPPTVTPPTTTPVTTPVTTTKPSVPGFEIVALIGAIAAALLVLRRKA